MNCITVPYGDVTWTGFTSTLRGLRGDAKLNDRVSQVGLFSSHWQIDPQDAPSPIFSVLLCYLELLLLFLIPRK